jgi:tRNA nucleotidyltransferase (CCA-adding enzyme)
VGPPQRPGSRPGGEELPERPRSWPDGEELLERLRSLPGGRELLEVAPPGAFLVGGAVRDLLAETGTDWGDTRSARIPKSASAEGACLPASVDRRPRELDVVVEDEDSPLGRAAALLAGDLAARLNAPAGADERSAGASEHARFGTATVEWPSGRIDVATARRERYPAPGALPEVEPAPLEEDLLRRDFTANALALALAGERPGELRGAPRALEDLRGGQLRVLHERSFLEDPTRLWRLARYRARLGFAVEERTAQLAAAAVAQGALRTVSGARLGAELRLALAEPDPLAALAALQSLGLLAALHPRLRFEAPLARRALELLGAGGEDRPELLLLAALVLPLALRAGGDPRAEILALLGRLELPGAERDRVVAAAAATPRLVDELPRAAAPSRLRDLAQPVPPEGVALAGAVSEPAAPAARRWLAEIRHVRLLITGEDLLAAGVPQGPEIGRRLEAALRAKLDGELPDGREAELDAALGRRG